MVRSLLAPLHPPIEVVGEAADGAEGLKLFHRYKPDIILTDIRMPEMDGLDFLAEVRESDPDVPVVLVSAYNEFEYAQKALKHGAFDYLLKPIDEEDLYRVLEKAREHLVAVRRKKKRLVKMETELRKLKDEIIGESGPAPTESHHMDGKTAIARTLHYLDSHYADDITQAEMARRVYLYPTYFSELFKKEIGKGFTEYLNQLRIEKAKALLPIKTLRVSEVAEMVGYRDHGYFTKQFRRYAGVSPAEYRATQSEKPKREESTHENDCT